MNFKQIIKPLLIFFGVKRILAYYNGIKHKDIVYNVNHTRNCKRCLFLYITEPFCTNKISEKHQNQWQAVEFARIIGSKGFIVDVANFQSKSLILKYNYDLVIGLIPRGIDVYTKHMNPGCKQVAYLTSMNLEVTSGNEEKRIEECYLRRGVRLRPRRAAGFIEKRIEEFDAAFYFGNDYNFHSYDCFKMPPAYCIKNTGYLFPWANPDVERDSHCFMFFGSWGQVHKGLDLLLELFAEEIQDCTLFVCGGFDKEEDFTKEYHRELYETKNIVPVGFVSIDSSKYRELSNKCAYTILPSCAEGCAGSVLANMSAGIIPIVSRECGFGDDEVILLSDCRKATIKEYILKYCHKDSDWIRSQSNHSIQIVRERYLNRNYTESVEKAINGVLYRSKE